MDGKLIQQGKGFYRLILEDGNSYDVSDIVKQAKDYDEDETEIYEDEYTINNSEVTSLTIQGIIYTNKMAKKKNPRPSGHSKKSQKEKWNPPRPTAAEKATAPYNFIPLPEKVLAFESENGKLYGFIDIYVKSKSPLFIRGKGSDFFKINNVPALPGSSLRGMLSTLVEIMSFGKFRFFDDDTYFYRRTDYRNQNFKSGFLKKGNGRYCIHECKNRSKGSDTKEFRYKFYYNTCVFSTGQVSGIKKWEFYNSGNGIMYPIKKNSKLFREYENDNNRGKAVPNVFISASDEKVKGVEIPDKFGMPVFFTTDAKGEVNYISHCKLGRASYAKSVKDHIPEALLGNSKTYDMVDCIFGTTEHMGKIFVEDALLPEDIDNYYLDKDREFLPKILSSPKPTSYQMYLEPNAQGRAENWNSDTPIRGHKLYWHRLTLSDGTKHSWAEEDGTAKTDSHPKYPIRPLRSELEFKGKIRFEKMTEIELGALLSALKLKEDLAHKLGLGKPLGLGSVRITPILTIINRKKRYNTLFNEEGDWELGEETQESFTSCVEAFEKYVLNALGLESGDYWKIGRIKELVKMLTFDVGKQEGQQWLGETSYMDKSHFRANKILPRPSEKK